MKEVAGLDRNADEYRPSGQTTGVRTVAIVRTGIKPLLLGRAIAAALFDEALRGRTEAGDFSASNCAIARQLGVSERHVRNLRAGDKPIPFGLVFAIDVDLARDVLRGALRRLTHGASPARSVESRIRRVTAIAGDLNAIVDDAGPRHLTPALRRALRLRVCRLIDEAERLALDLSEETS
jgi:hypothetical protein